MTWETNSVTFVRCDDRRHVGDPIAKIETASNVSARDALLAEGWHYFATARTHKCPPCTRRLAVRN